MLGSPLIILGVDEEAWYTPAGISKARKVDVDLDLLGLTELTDLATLHNAYRNQSRTAHPNAGGTDEAFIALRNAYDRLKLRVQ